MHSLATALVRASLAGHAGRASFTEQAQTLLSSVPVGIGHIARDQVLLEIPKISRLHHHQDGS